MIKSIAVFCISFLTIFPLSGQPTLWEQTAGPPGLQVNVFYETNGVVYAGTETHGVYKSTDNGLSWIAANNGIERASISDIIFSGGNLLAAAKSSCQSFLNVFKSTDGGVTWSATTGLSGRLVHSFAIKNSSIYAGVATFPGSSGVARSTDNGNTWQEVATPIENGGEIFVSDNAIIVGEDNLIWRSLDDGASWNVVDQLALTGTHSFARAGTKLFAAGTTVIGTSTDNGGSWTYSPFPDGANSFSSNGSTVYLGSNSKVFKSTDFGATWMDVSTGLGHGGIRALLYDGTNLFAGTPADGAGVYRSTNGGMSWEAAVIGLPIGSQIRGMTSFGGYIFAGVDGDGIYRSNDRGNTWAKTDVNNSLLKHETIRTFCAKGDALFAAGPPGIFKSTDGGATFARIQNGFPANTNVTVLSLTVSDGNIVAAANISLSPTGQLSTVFYSSDDGANWHEAIVHANASWVPAVASDGSSLAYAGIWAQARADRGIYKSTDGGMTWTHTDISNAFDIERLAAKGSNVLLSELNTAWYSTNFGESFAPGLPPSPPDVCPFGCGIDTYTLRGNSIFGGYRAGMYLSVDSGATWAAVNEGFPTCPIPNVQASCADSDHLFVGTAGEGAWRKVVDSITPSPTPTPTPSATATPTPPVPTPTPTLTPTPSPAAQAINLSTRMRVQTGDNVGIGGFIITGSASKHLLLRAIGPSLTQLGVPDALADPVLELHGPGGFGTMTNNNWRDTQEAQIQATGIAPTNNLESAIDATLAPGAYTAVVRGNGNTSGVALVEVYDLSPPVPAKLANISTRAFVSTGDNIVIAGFILGGSGNDRIIARGIGPSLTGAGVPDALANPTLALRDSNGALLVMNDDWQDDAAQAAELIASGLAPTNQLESGIAATLPPGLYTALLAGLNNGAGIGLVEVYDRGAP